MDLTPYIESLRRELSAAAEVAGEEARTAAERLTGALDASVRLALIDALSTAADEITRDLAPGSVEVRMRGRNPDFVVTPPAPEPPEPEGPPAPPPPPPPPGDADQGEQGTARITLRLPEALKNRVEEASAAEGMSVNAWLVRTINAAVTGRSGGGDQSFGYRGSRGPKIGQRLSGWAR